MGQKTPIIVYPFLSAFLPLYLSACLFDSDPDACLSVCSTSLFLFLSPSAFVSLLLYLSMAPESHILVCPSIPSSLALSLCLCICVSPSPILCLSACVMMNLNPMPYSSVHSIPSHSHCLGVSNSLPTSASLSLLWPALYLSVSLCLSASLYRWRSLHIIDLSSALISSSAIGNEHFTAHSVTSHEYSFSFILPPYERTCIWRAWPLSCSNPHPNEPVPVINSEKCISIC